MNSSVLSVLASLASFIMVSCVSTDSTELANRLGGMNLSDPSGNSPLPF
jgi:hypothetical protein